MRLYGPVKKKVGTGSTILISFINDNLYCFQRGNKYRFIKIGSDRMSFSIKVFCLVDVYRVRFIYISHAYGRGQTMRSVFCLTVNLRVD